MKKQILISLLIALFTVLPNIVVAQEPRIYAQMEVALYEIQDRGEIRLDNSLKDVIASAFRSALSKSQNYKPFTINIDEIKRSLKAKGKSSESPANIIKEYEERGVDYLVYIETIAIGDRWGLSQISISAKLYRILTKSYVNDDTKKVSPDHQSIKNAIDQLISSLLGEKTSAQNQTYQQPQGNYGYSNGYGQQQPSYQQPQGNYGYSNGYGQQQPSYQQPQGNYGYSNGYGQQQPTYQQRSQNYTETIEGINMQMVYLEGGSFIMGATEEQRGDAYSDESPSHRVTLDSYYIGAFEVTQAQWRAIMGNNPSYFTGDNNPVEKVSWHDAQAFCQELSNLTGRTYMLPTEAQWEYAARGGNKSRKNKYSGSFAIDVVAWYTSNSGSKTHPVGGKRANELGLYDMSGNVWEWCNDWYGSYSSSPQTNPTGPSSGQYRVLRGGGWYHDAGSCRVSYRGSDAPSGVSYIYGFRVVCLP